MKRSAMEIKLEDNNEEAVFSYLNRAKVFYEVFSNSITGESHVEVLGTIEAHMDTIIGYSDEMGHALTVSL
jgi:hypothetical protein